MALWTVLISLDYHASIIIPFQIFCCIKILTYFFLSVSLLSGRSLSISLGNFAVAKPTEANLDSIYAFSDDEGVSGYQELLKTPSKPPPVNKKEKKEKKEKKSSKPGKHHKNHHHHHHKHNGKPENMVPQIKSSGFELQHLLTTVGANQPSVIPQATPKFPKTDVTTPPPHKKHKKSKSSKKDRSSTLSKTEASILDGIFAAMNKEAELYAKLKAAKSESSTLQTDAHSQSKLQMGSVKASPPSVKMPAVQPPSVSCKTVVDKSGPPDITQTLSPPVIHSPLLQKSSPFQETSSTADDKACKLAEQKIKLAESKIELTPPTLNKMQDVPLSAVADTSSATADVHSEMPPLIPAGELEPSPIPDTNKFQDAFLLQLAESLKATKSKSEKNSKSKPKKARVKDKDKEASKKSAKKEGKTMKTKKEGKQKEKKQQQQVHPPKPKTSHLAELLKRPGSLDLTNIDPKNMVNGFYVAGASSGVALENSVVESVVNNTLQSPTPGTQPATGVKAPVLPMPSDTVNKSADDDVRSSALLSPKNDTENNSGQKSVQNVVEQKRISNITEEHVIPHALKTENQGNGLMSPGLMNEELNPGLVTRKVNPGLMNQTLMPSFDSMEDDILQNCIDPNLLQKPSSRAEQRSQSLDSGMLQRKSKPPPPSPPPVDVYQFMPNSDTDLVTTAKPATSSKKAQGTKAKATKAKPKPKAKKKKVVNPNSKPVPRGRSNSLPPSSSNVASEAQKFVANGMMNLEMMQEVFSSPGGAASNDTLLELERTQQHIVSGILHDHNNQAAPPEQLYQRQRAAMIMQEKFRELQQLQMRMQMAQQNSQGAQRPSGMPALVELRRPPIHMRFPGPQHPMFNSGELQQQQNQLQQQQQNQLQQQQQHHVPGMQMPSSSAATMMQSYDQRLSSPRHGQPNMQPMMSPNPHAPLPSLSPQQSPNPQMHSMVPASPKSMMVPSPKGMMPLPSPKSKLPPPSPKSVPVPSPKSMLPNSPTSMPPPSPSMLPPSPSMPPPSPSMPPPSPQSGPPSNNSMMAASPQSMMPPSPQAPSGPNLQARLQQTSPTPGPTSPIMMMQGRSHAGMLPNQRMMASQQRMQSGAMMPPSPHGMMQPQASPQPVLSPRSALNPPLRFSSPTTSQSQMGSVPGDRTPFPYRSPLPSPQSSPTGTPTQRLPPLHSLLRQSTHQMPPSPHGIQSSLPSPGSNPATSPIQSPHASPNNHHLQNPVFQRGIPAALNQIPPHQQQHPLSPVQQHRPTPAEKQQYPSPGQQHAMSGHFQGNVPIHNMPRPGGFPVRMGFPSPPPGYVSPTAGSIPRRPSFTNAHMNKIDSSTELQMASQHASPNKAPVGIINPWNWSIADVIQFIADAGEAGCAEPFRRQVSYFFFIFIKALQG